MNTRVINAPPPALGMNDEQLDALFEAAGQI